MTETVVIVSDNLFGIISQFKSFVTNSHDYESLEIVNLVLFPAIFEYMQRRLLTVILLIRSKEDSHTIFRDAAALNMTESGYIWIVTEQALNANNTPDGVIGLQLVHAKNEKNHIKVSI